MPFVQEVEECRAFVYLLHCSKWALIIGFEPLRNAGLDLDHAQFYLG